MWAATLAQPDTAFVSNDNKNNNDRVSYVVIGMSQRDTIRSRHQQAPP